MGESILQVEGLARAENLECGNSMCIGTVMGQWVCEGSFRKINTEKDWLGQL